MSGGKWVVFPCHGCRRPMTTDLVMVSSFIKLADGAIGIKDQALGRFCSMDCLAAWAIAQVKGD